MQSSKEETSLADTLAIARQVKSAATKLAALKGTDRSRALTAIADKLEAAKDEIYVANQIDLKEAELLFKKGEISQAALGRLKFDQDKLTTVVEGIRQLAKIEDPIGRSTWGMQLDEGLELFRVNSPVGVVAVIFESRPDALPQIVSLCLRTANACILKGGKEAINSNRLLFKVIDEAMIAAGMPEHAVALLETRQAVEALLKANGIVDLIIPRGSNQLVSHIQNNTTIPVLGHAEGICHIYVDEDADLTKATRIILDAKITYPTACNAVETVLVHKKIAAAFIPALVKQLRQNKVEVRADQASGKLLQDATIKSATEADWSAEYGDLILALKIVESTDDAIAHINQYGSHHTDSMISENEKTFAHFFASVDSAGVFLNASTRFADGFRYGFGAEVGIATGKLHPRGPVGLDGLITYKYKLTGSGHVVADYTGKAAKPFLHKSLPTD